MMIEEEQPQPQINTQKQYPKSKVALHHIPFPYLPSTITALKCNQKLQYLAVGKDNGIIEVFNCPTFIPVGIYTSVSSTVRSILWITDASFVACYLSGQVALFSIHHYKPINIFQLPQNINIFSTAALNNEESFIIACSDGALRTLEIDQDRIIYKAQTQQIQDQACICVCVKNDKVYASFSSGHIRVYSVKLLTLITSWSLNISNQAIAKSSLIIPWQVCVSNNNLIVGTSNGSIIVYETQFHTQIQQMQSHQADILVLLPYLENVYATGVDSKIVCLSYNNGQYSITATVRGQSHDIFALELLNTKKIVSGGVTTDLCLYHIDEDGVLKTDAKSSKQFHLTTIPSTEHFQFHNNILIVNKFTSIDLLTISNQTQLVYLSEIQLNTPCHFIQSNNQYLVYGQPNQTIILSIDSDHQLHKFRTLPHCKKLTISQHDDSFYLIDGQDRLYKYQLKQENGKFITQLPISQPKSMEFIDNKTLLITYPTIQKFVSVKGTDVHETDCQVNENLVTNIISIKGNSKYVLVSYASQLLVVYVFDTATTGWKMTKYSREFMLKSPMNYKLLKEQIKGVITDPKDDKRLLLYTNNHLVRVHLRGRPPREFSEVEFQDKVIPQTSKQNSKKDLLAQDLHIDNNFTSIYQNNLIAAALQIEGNEYILLEWDKELSFSKLPNPFNAKKYKQ